MTLLSAHTTLHLGGPAKRFLVARTDAEILDGVVEADGRREPLLLLGGGSNLVVGDAGFEGLVVKVETRGVARVEGASAVRLTVAAGEDWDAFVASAVAAGLSGVEALSGIPGRVGATPIQNVGAYGQEVKDTIASVRVWDRQARAEVRLSAAECDFRYRESRLKDEPDRFVVLAVEFELPKNVQSAPVAYAELARALGVREGERAPLAKVRETVIALRRSKGMVLDSADPDTTSAGSFFTNPIVFDHELAAIEARVRDKLGESVQIPRFPGGPGRTKLPAAWLIERAGFTKGFRKGNAAISSKHTLALVNHGGTTAELLELARTVRAGVEAAFGVSLVPEPVMVGCAL